jgi:alpha-N-arabinofuranosidase
MTRRLVLVVCLACSTAVFGQQEAVIEVDATRVLHSIPRTIYGTFLEPIGHSIYGGLWAQVLENPSFEADLWSADAVARMVRERPELGQASRIGLPLPWEPLDASQGNRYEPRWNDAANSYRSLLIMAMPGKQSGVRQMVYLPVHRELRYNGSLYAKHVSGPAEIEVSLRRRNHPEAVLARQTIRVAGNAWAKRDFTLELAKGSVATREPVDFVIAASDDARVLVDQAFLSPADAIQGMNPEMIDMVRALKSPVLRFGGNFTSGYHWRDGIGPIDKRVTMLNQAWGMPEYNHFGTDELLEFCKLIGAEPQIALNLGSGEPQEAADWVRYVNGKWGDRSGGLLWELGNELWGTFQIGYPTIERIAARTKTFSAAVRQVDPRSRLIATGQDPDHFKQWNAKQLELGPDAFNYLSTHFVVGPADVLKKNPTREFVAAAGLALPVGLERQLRAMKEQIDADPATRGRVKIAFTEWLFISRGSEAPNYDNLGGALCTGGFLNTLMRVADFTPVADMTGSIEFGGVWQKRGRVFGVPAYWVFRMYSNANATKLLSSSVQVETYNVEEGVRRLPTIHDVPSLDVVAASNDAGDRLTLFCVNRHQTHDIDASVRLTGFEPNALSAQQLTATSLYAGNDEVQPRAVSPAQLNLSVSSGGFRHTFPRSSITVIELTKRQ